MNLNPTAYLPTDAIRAAYHDNAVINAVLALRKAMRDLGCPVQVVIDDEAFSIAGTRPPRPNYPGSA